MINSFFTLQLKGEKMEYDFDLKNGSLFFKQVKIFNNKESNCN